MTTVYGIKSTKLFKLDISGSEVYIGADSLREALDTWEQLENARKAPRRIVEIKGRVKGVTELGEVYCADV